jgi:hypothetical protein
MCSGARATRAPVSPVAAMRHKQSPAPGHIDGTNRTLSNGHVKWRRYRAPVKVNFLLSHRVKP